MFEDNNINIIYTVSEITSLLKEVVEREFYFVGVKGEVSSVKNNYSSGHLYFDLKDDSTKINCVIFRNDLNRILFEIKDGMSVIVFGRLNIYGPRSSYNIVVSLIEPEGYGQLALAYEQLKEKLREKGLFDDKHKRQIPFLPQTIGIVTSRGGAVLHDIIKVITARFDAAHLIFVNASVQGLNSSKEITEAIELLNKYSKQYCKIDVMIVGRGGGSLEDLWSFNEEATAYSIFNSEIPVISAVGHESDNTIADLVADRRAPTPSAAAEMIVPVKSELIYKITGIIGRLKLSVANKRERESAKLNALIERRRLKHPLKVLPDKKIRMDDLTSDLYRSAGLKLETLKTKLEDLKDRLGLKNPSSLIKNRKIEINNLLMNMQKSLNYGISIYRHKSRYLLERTLSFDLLNEFKREINILQKALDSLSPYAVLKRGYSIVFSQKKEVISSVLKVKENEDITISVSDGSINAIVLSKVREKT